RPRKDLAGRIAALPYDVSSRQEVREVVKNNPLSFLKIDRAETQLDEKIDIYSEKVYQCAADTLNHMIDNGEFQQEEKPCFYIYELTMDGRVQTGIGACAAVREYENQIIKKHENTRQDKEDDRTRHIKVCEAQTGPIFLAYRYDERIALLQEEEKKKPAEYDFTSEDGIRHRMWIVKEEHVIKRLEELFQSVPSLYIADGHHRAASAARVAAIKREQEHVKIDESSLPEYEYFMSVIFADRDLMVMDYNRWIKDLNGMTGKQFIEKLKREFSVYPISERTHPEKKGQFTMYTEHQWYLLEEINKPERKDSIENLDVSVLQNSVLCPLLGIDNPKTDQRISFIGGIRGLKALEDMVDEKGGVAFAMYPTSMQELFAVADEGRLMPPKSTWFEPKLRSGLLIHRI
ncbi:MAG: DUF1015 domain-containing protein, partial [Oliverpabstia sp.]